MFCSQCGAQNEDNAVFCRNCGNQLHGASAAAPVYAQEAPSSKKPSNKGKIIAIVAVVVVAALAVCAVVWFQMNQAKHAPHKITVSIHAENYSDADTLIPIRAAGTDFERNAVDELFFVNAAGQGISLPKGHYTLSVEASPLTADGILYKETAETIEVTIGTDTEDNADVDASSAGTIELKKSTALEESDEAIQKAYDIAIQDESQKDKAETLHEVAVKAHEEAVATKKQEEERAKARQNPSSVNAVSGEVTLKGKLTRQERTTNETGTGWASVDYLLVFDSPVSITYKTASGSTATNSFTSICVASKELYTTSDPNANSKLGSTTIPELQQYVGKYVAVTGTLFDSGNMHTYGHTQFSSYTIKEI